MFRAILLGASSADGYIQGCTPAFPKLLAHDLRGRQPRFDIGLVDPSSIFEQLFRQLGHVCVSFHVEVESPKQGDTRTLVSRVLHPTLVIFTQPAVGVIRGMSVPDQALLGIWSIAQFLSERPSHRILCTTC